MLISNNFSILVPQYRPFPPPVYFTSSVGSTGVYTYPANFFPQPSGIVGRVSASPLGITSMPANLPIQFYML